MTKKHKELVLAGFQAAAAGLTAEELPDWILERGKALPYYREAAAAKDPEKAFLALYNAYGMLLGFRPGTAAMAEDLGVETRVIRSLLARIRRDDGDAEPAEAAGPAPTKKQLDCLLSAFRRRILKL